MRGPCDPQAHAKRALDLGLAVEKFEELAEYAREWGNRPLLAHAERARADFSERLQLLEEHTKSVSVVGL